MRIISWNVNGFRSSASKGAISKLIEEYSPDLLFMQELKCTETEFYRATWRYVEKLAEDYICYVDGSIVPGRSGVALVAKAEIALDAEGNDLIQWFDSNLVDSTLNNHSEARLQAFIINGILMLNTYSVSVQPDLFRLDYSNHHDQQILNLLGQWKELGNEEALVIGDLNLVHQPIDFHEYRLTLPQRKMTLDQRERYRILFRQEDLYDTFRYLHPHKVEYSYWSYRGHGRSSGKGYRLDYSLVTTALLNKVLLSDILTDIKGSDHAPIILELED